MASLLSDNQSRETTTISSNTRTGVLKTLHELQQDMEGFEQGLLELSSWKSEVQIFMKKTSENCQFIGFMI